MKGLGRSGGDLGREGQGLGLHGARLSPIAVAGTVTASFGWLRRCDEGASHAECENEVVEPPRRMSKSSTSISAASKLVVW